MRTRLLLPMIKMKLSDTQKIKVFRIVANPDIVLFRHKWKIPISGFKNTDSFTVWNIVHVEHYTSASLKKVIDENGDELNEIYYTNRDAKGIKFLTYNFAFLETFLQDLKELLDHYRLTLSFLERVLWLIIYDRDIINSSKVSITHSKDNRSLILRIYPDTTIKDIQKVWSEVLESQEYLKGRDFGKKRNKPSTKSLDIQLRIYELKRSGSKLKDIKKIIKDEFGKIIMEYQISGIITRFEKKYLPRKDSL